MITLERLANRLPFWRRLLRTAIMPAAVACFGLSGCATFWDDVTSREFEFRSLWVKPDPLVVLRDSKDGDQRAKAYRMLHEPAQDGGSKEEQDVVVNILCTAVQTERTAWCRQAAISSLRNFKDPRAADALKEAYYKASAFPAETANIIRCQALTALGDTGNPVAIELLVKVVKEPPVEGPEQDKQQKMAERIAAARALGKFKNYDATQTLVVVLKTEKDPALRDRVHESLQLATGKRFPQEAQAWEEYLRNTPNKDDIFTDGPGLSEQLLDILTVSWWN